MLHIDEKYLYKISPSLKNFQKRNRYLYNCSCPVCGDSKINRTKARGYFYPNREKSSLIYKCHNCGVSTNISALLRDRYPEEYSQYYLEKYLKNDRSREPHETQDNPLNSTVKQTQSLWSATNASTIDSLPTNHLVREYLHFRKISPTMFRYFWYTDDYKKLVLELFPEKYADFKFPDNDKRLVIPFYNRTGDLIGIQGRTLTNAKMRYVTNKSDNRELVFGVERCDILKRVYVVEGPIDSVFLPNALAVATSDLLSITGRFPEIPQNRVFIPDNQPRNKEIIKIVAKIINANEKVCIWPANVKSKDINQMILDGMNIGSITDMIEQNTYFGISANLKFNEWRKI